MKDEQSKRGATDVSPPRHVKEALYEVLDYLWESELTDAFSTHSESDNHIFPALVSLQNWVDGQDHSVPWFVYLDS